MEVVLLEASGGENLYKNLWDHSDTIENAEVYNSWLKIIWWVLIRVLYERT